MGLEPKPAPFIMLDGPAPRCMDKETGVVEFDFLGQMNSTDGMRGEGGGSGGGLMAAVESFVEVQIDDVYRDLIVRIQALEERVASSTQTEPPVLTPRAGGRQASWYAQLSLRRARRPQAGHSKSPASLIEIACSLFINLQRPGTWRAGCLQWASSSSRRTRFQK